MAFDVSTWGWPQWTYAIFYFVTLLIVAAMNGKPRTGEYNFAMSVMVSAVYIVILGFGGFWG